MKGPWRGEGSRIRIMKVGLNELAFLWSLVIHVPAKEDWPAGQGVTAAALATATKKPAGASAQVT